VQATGIETTGGILFLKWKAESTVVEYIINS
jgi:hypothetical protein